MNKVDDGFLVVIYKFESEIIIGERVNEDGKLSSLWETKYGYCKFNKQTEKFELDKEKTDPYYTEKNREVIKVQYNLIKRKRENFGYPDRIEIIVPG
jgi:hypothetical protein